MLRRITGLVRKEFAQIARDVPLVVIHVWAFTAAIYSAGRGRTAGVNDPATALYALSEGRGSREFLSHLQRPYFKVVAYLTQESQIAEYLNAGKASIVVFVPPTYQRDVDGRRTAHVQVLTDGALAMPATVAVAYVAAIS